ncbi:ElaB/YqjD/DUF883 family membrane-anchored ribosome-binding protein [Angulomicrobium tetraedrale]|uniref:ElaB/YqjD/DUF883 family membrane-anchored ribosome-binding protein n=1 Tax=Ancylobacter tetraedralis TaxID=217068 RepID=A0A839Z6P3_9HYPH|nr:DUF883 family protein [Ancylobacter tetraedralis]MBB3770713.1 ElaB/YqjD/DUF883 family membrane-anchored ribosome-binding protein [Ancylobacter tetraedralis]
MAEPNAQEDFAQLSADLAVLRADVARLAETLTTLAKVQGEAAADAVASRVRQGKEKAEATAADLMEEGADAYQEAKERASQFGGEVTATIERNPLGAVAAALGVGFLLGLITRGR